MAKAPDPPPAPLINTLLPATAVRTPCRAIAPACGMVDAWANVRAAGLSASTETGASAYSAKPPLSARLSPYTSSPGRNRVTPGPTSSTPPATYDPRVRRAGRVRPPIRAYAGDPRRHSQSLRLTDVAATFTRTWPAAGEGIGTSATRKTSQDPYRSYKTAFMPTPCDSRSWQQHTGPAGART